MRFYKPIIWSGVISIIIINLANDLSFASFLSLLYVFVVCLIPTGLFVFVTRMLPYDFYDPYRKLFHVFSFERKLYEKMGIKRWKRNVPELGQLVDFRKNKLADPTDKEYLEKFLNENMRGDLVHAFSMVWGFVALLFIPSKYVLSAGLPIAIIQAFLHSLPWFIQRYLRPRILRIYERAK